MWSGNPPFCSEQKAQNSNGQVDEKLTTILNRTLNLFFIYGVKPITMDEIARDQGLSKKTLYLNFANKADLVQQTFKHYLKSQEQAVTQIQKANLNPIKELYQVYNLKVQNIFYISPALPMDLQRHFAQAWDLCLSHRDEFLFHTLVENFHKGMKTDWYRQDFEVKIMASLFLNQLDFVFYNYAHSQGEYALDRVTSELFNYHIRGIGTEKGVDFAENNQGK